MRFLAGLAALLLSAAALAQAPAGFVPIPPVARVTDLTGTLTPADLQALEAKLAAFEQAKGSQVAVLMVPSIGDETIEEFAGRVADKWALGRKGVDDGVLFAVALQQRKMRIHTGRGVQGTLTDAASKRIIAERVAPLFRSGDFAGGVNAGVDAIHKAIEGEALPPPPQRTRGQASSGSDDFGTLALLAFFVVPLVAQVLRSMFGRLGGATLTSGVAGGAAWLILGSIAFGLAAAVVGFMIALMMGSGGGARGARSGPWIGGGGFGGGGGGGWSGGGGGGGFSGGGGGFDGGGASGGW